MTILSKENILVFVIEELWDASNIISSDLNPSLTKLIRNVAKIGHCLSKLYHPKHEIFLHPKVSPEINFKTYDKEQDLRTLETNFVSKKKRRSLFIQVLKLYQKTSLKFFIRYD